MSYTTNKTRCVVGALLTTQNYATTQKSCGVVLWRYNIFTTPHRIKAVRAEYANAPYMTAPQQISRSQYCTFYGSEKMKLKITNVNNKEVQSHGKA